MLNGTLEILANNQGTGTIPFYVPFTDEERILDEAAVYQAAVNLKRAIFDIK
jgi:molecular chaperone DnaK (HSP70)